VRTTTIRTTTIRIRDYDLENLIFITERELREKVTTAPYRESLERILAAAKRRQGKRMTSRWWTLRRWYP
jgi:hypothetical protein